MGKLMPRRTMLAGAAGAAVSAIAPPLLAAGPAVTLRLLATSDLHMFVADYDYYRDREDDTVGLARTARLIDEARAEVANCLLLDNGDLIQGNPLGDFLAADQGLAPGTLHPMIRAMNLLGYDAAAIGNHEFNFGLDFLGRALAGARFPQICANVLKADGAPWLPPSAVLEREVADESGERHRLRIGVIGFVTPQITMWDRSKLSGRLVTQDIVEAAERHVPALRAEADLVVALCHSGISAAERRGGDENAALYLARVPGIDAIVTGHQHRVFPGPDYDGRPGIDAARGLLAGVPAVMPGFWGSHLGVIDLTLARAGAGWTVTGSRSEARPIYRREHGTVVPLAAPEPRLVAAIEPEHHRAIAAMRRPVGSTAAPITSYFALAGHAATVALVNDAQRWYLRPLLAGTRHEALPLLSAAAPFKAGGQPGPDNYTEIPAGPVALRDVADLYIFPNTVRAVRVSGAQIKEWLEYSARIFLRLDPGRDGPQPLIDPRIPSYDFDIIAGLSYAIDVTRPRRYGAEGRLEDAGAERILELMHDGRPVAPDAEFIVATNNYRADGGGRFPGLGDPSVVVVEAPDSNRDAIERYLAAHPGVSPDPAGPWRFAPAARRLVASLDSAPAARRYLAAYPEISDLGDAGNGFARFAVAIG